MKTLATLIRWELRLGRSSMRCKVAVLLYLLLCCVSPVLLFLLSQSMSLGVSTFLHNLLDAQAFLTLLLALILAGHRSGNASWPEMRPVLTSARLSSTHYLIGRWLALVMLIVPVTFIPVVVTAVLATLAEGGELDALAWTLSWILQIVPMVLAGVAMWLGLVTILGGELAALGISFVGFSLALALVNEALLRFRLVIETSLSLDSFSRFQSWPQRAVWLFNNRHEPYKMRFYLSSDAPFDPRSMAEWYLPNVLMGLCVAILVLTLGVFYVRRAVRDLRPYPLRPNHPLRTYLTMLLRLREQLLPAAAPARTEILALCCGLLILTTGFCWSFVSQKHYQALASERYEVVTGDPFAPMARGILPESWTITGEVNLRGSIDLDVSTTLRFAADLVPEDGPQSQLAFALNENIEIAKVDTPGRQVTAQRAWDRVRLDIEPPLAPGEKLEIHWRLVGQPGFVYFPLGGNGSDTFVRLFDRLKQARFVRDMADLSHSRRFLAVSPRRLELEATDLSPVPRYTPWTLVIANVGGGEEQPLVADETVHPPVDFAIDLGVPTEFFVADACGTDNRGIEAAEEVSRIIGDCRLPFQDYTVYGTSLAVSNQGGITFALLESHQDKARDFSQSLVRIADLSDKAWPGLEGFGDLVVVEWVPHFQYRGKRNGWTWFFFNLQGQLLLLDEYALSQRYISMGEMLVSELLTRELLAQRPVEPSQDLFFRHWYATLMQQRMGLSSQTSALMASSPMIEIALRQSLLRSGQYSMTNWRERMPAVLIDLQHRIGAKKLMDGMVKFLALADTGSGATVREMFAVLEQESGVSLQRFHDDFIVGTGAPNLFLEDVESRRDGQGFRVTGNVVNRGSGEVFCPLVLKTEVEPTRVQLRIPSAATTAFNIRLEKRPLSVELDPNGTCLRVVAATRFGAERVEL